MLKAEIFTSIFSSADVMVQLPYYSLVELRGFLVRTEKSGDGKIERRLLFLGLL